MSTHRLEARVSALERRELNLEAHIEELSEDITTSIKELSNDMTASFKQVGTYINAIEERFEKIERDIATIKTTMATKEDLITIKEDMTAMEGRILDAFKQLLVTVNPQNQNPPAE
jgi:uncharacterized coiled-coil protein SlyX